MSVSALVALPDQPALGFVRSRPLGGNGYQSPFNQSVVKVAVNSDVSGGTNEITVQLDPTYLNLVSTIEARVNSAAADIALRVLFKVGPNDEILQLTSVVPFLDASVGSVVNAARVWTPPPVLVTDNRTSGDSSVAMAVPNTDGEQLILSMWIYQFSKRAEEFSPVDVLLAALSRGTAIT